MAAAQAEFHLLIDDGRIVPVEKLAEAVPVGAPAATFHCPDLPAIGRP
jgi:hypothetical protein